MTAPYTPWLITLSAYRELCAALAIKPTATPAASDAEKPYDLQGGLATVPLHGTLMRDIPPAMAQRAAIYGVQLCSMSNTASTLRELAENPAIHTVLLDVDSPGGTVNGTPELAYAVQTLAQTKHVYTYTSGRCCSAAYWVASQSDVIYAAPSAMVGSIGVLLPLVDTSGLYERNGIKVEAIAAGKYKSTGLDGTALTDEQRALLTQRVESIWQQFKTAVNTRRSVAAEHMEGQSFYGNEARDKGLVDACAYSLAEVQYRLMKRHGGNGF